MSTEPLSLAPRIEDLITRAVALESRLAPELSLVHPAYEASARNLVHYLALRQVDIRALQDQLARYGLSSLGRAEQHVLPSLRAVATAIEAIGGKLPAAPLAQDPAFAASLERMPRHVEALLGGRRRGRNTRIMVTLPPEAAENPAMVRDLVATGMDIARINCAHDTGPDWEMMIRHVRQASAELGVECRIVMDLVGPKFRTGDLVPGPKVLRVQPRRDALGRLIAPKRVRFAAEDVPWQGKKVAVVPVPQELIDHAAVGDEVRFTDTRGRKRSLSVVEKDDRGLVLEAHKTAYLATGTRMRLIKDKSGDRLKFLVGELPPVEQPIILRTGDALVLEKTARPGEPARTEDEMAEPAHITCLPGDIFGHLSPGAPVRLNDGKIEGFAEAVYDDSIRVRITGAKPSGSRLRGNRSINFPNAELHYQGLTAADRGNLEFIAAHADAVDLSFIRDPGDIVALHTELARFRREPLGIICKIETERAFRNLPRILLAAMRHYPAGVMIARGDLAIECGWERLAEIQEEILWLCEAAQLPVIWATQVLEGEAKKGQPTRAEITDAAMSQRADCVMLNKGPQIISAIRMLDDIMRRMEQHQSRKSSRLRRLSISDLWPGSS